MVLIWDLLNSSGNAASTSTLGLDESQRTHTQASAAISEDVFQGPIASWECEYEVNNIGWAPQSVLTSRGNDWVGVVGGNGVWGVCI